MPFLSFFDPVKLTFKLTHYLIFDADLPDDMFTLAMNSLAIISAPSNESKCANVVRLEAITSFSKLHNDIDRHEYLRGRYIVIPNVSEGGNTTLLRSGHAGHYKDMPCVGGYLDGSVAQLGIGNKAILEGRDNSYGNKPLALFQTSDCVFRSKTARLSE